MSWLPNALTLLRMLAALPLFLCIVHGLDTAAFWLAVVAGASDGLDGWLAKRFGWTSRLGAILDPLSDKVLMLAVMLALTWTGDLPVWLLGLALARDICLVLGGLVYHWRYEKLTPQPTVPGKLTTLALVLLIVVVLAGRASGWSPGWLLDLLIGASTLLLCLSWIHYWLIWSPRSKAVAQRRQTPP